MCVLAGCSVVTPKETVNQPNIAKNEKKWHFFYQDRKYRFRLQTMNEDTNRKHRFFSFLKLYGYKQKESDIKTPEQLLLLAMKTDLKNVKLVKGRAISRATGHPVPVYFYTLEADTPRYRNIGRYPVAKVIDEENLNKIKKCFMPDSRFKEAPSSIFKEGWIPRYGGEDRDRYRDTQCFRIIGSEF